MGLVNVKHELRILDDVDPESQQEAACIDK